MTSLSHDHLSDEELFEDMDGHPTARVADHCAVCPVCRSLRQQMSEAIGALRFEPEPALSVGLRERLLLRHAHAHRPRPAILRLITYRVPLYQVAVAAAAVVMLSLAVSRPQPPARVGVFPPFVAAVSDLSVQRSPDDAGIHRGLHSDLGTTDQGVQTMPNRPSLELDENGSMPLNQ